MYTVDLSRKESVVYMHNSTETRSPGLNQSFALLFRHAQGAILTLN